MSTDETSKVLWFRANTTWPVDPRYVELGREAQLAWWHAMCVAKERDASSFASRRHFLASVRGGFSEETLDELIDAGLLTASADGSIAMLPDDFLPLRKPADPTGARRAREYRERQAASLPPATEKERNELLVLAGKAGVSKHDLAMLRQTHTDKAASSEFTTSDVQAMTAAINELGAVRAGEPNA